MIKLKPLQKKSKHRAQGIEHKSLSIQFSLDGFSFCISNTNTLSPIGFTEYTFEKTLATPEELLKKVEHIFSTDTHLQQDFKSIEVIHQNNLATLVPTGYFDEEKVKTYLNFNIKTLVTDFIAYDDLQEIDTKNVYIPYVNINNYLFQNFGEFEYKHYTTVLIDKLLKHSAKNTDKSFFVHVSKHSLDIVVTNSNQLLFYNSFPFTTKEDFIYYILFVAEQLNLDTDTFQLTFLGDIEKESEIYNITYNYVRNIDFIKSESTFFSDSEFSKHSNFILVS